MDDKIDKLREELWRCIRVAQADGHQVLPRNGAFYIGTLDGLCLLGAVLYSNHIRKPDHAYHARDLAVGALSLAPDQIHMLEDGFENWYKNDPDTPYRALGREIRLQLETEKRTA